MSSNYYCNSKHEQLEEGLGSLPDIPAPVGFTASLLARLPRLSERKTRFHRWRTALAVAALLLLLGSPLYGLTDSARPMVESTDLHAGIELVGNTVTVKAGEVLRGDLRVYNTELRVQGRIEGTVYLAASNLSIESPRAK
ncbi:MAG: Anti-sigma-W factor RsiW [Firmicutes bacterium]|nr:Anti-sigma-W factor RsiW [Bacillota bacterium]